MKSYLTPEMAAAAIEAQQQQPRTAEQRIAESQRVDGLRKMFETTQSAMESHRSGVKAANTLITLYGENPEVRKLEARAASEVARLRETVVDQEMNYRQADSDMLAPDVLTAIGEDEDLAFMASLDGSNEIMLNSPMVLKFQNRFGHIPTPEERAIVRKEIHAARAGRAEQLQRLKEKQAYLSALESERKRALGHAPDDVARPAVRAEVQAVLDRGARLEDLTRVTTAEIFPLENEAVNKRRYLEDQQRLKELRRAKAQIMDQKQSVQTGVDQQQMSAARKDIV